MNKTTKSSAKYLILLLLFVAIAYFTLPLEYWIPVGVVLMLTLKLLIWIAAYLYRKVDNMDFRFFGHDN